MITAVIAALPREIAALVRGLQPDHALRQEGIYLYRREGVVIVAAGMGSERAALAVAAARQSISVEVLFSVGLAGSCSPEVHPGTLQRASLVIDSLTGERFSTSEGEGSTVLVSTPQIASTAEKKRLHAAYTASIVDMEAATVGRLARAHGLGFFAIKGVSDAHDLNIEHLSRFADVRGHFRTRRFAAHTALRPQNWRNAITLGRHSKAALAQMTEFLLPLMKTSSH